MGMCVTHIRSGVYDSGVDSVSIQQLCGLGKFTLPFKTELFFSLSFCVLHSVFLSFFLTSLVFSHSSSLFDLLLSSFQLLFLSSEHFLFCLLARCYFLSSFQTFILIFLLLYVDHLFFFLLPLFFLFQHLHVTA